MTTDPIRKQVVEAMAQALFRWNCDGSFAWPRSPKQQAEWLAGGAEILDALLDGLEEQREWIIDLSPGDEQWTLRLLNSLIAALRAGKGSE